MFSGPGSEQIIEISLQVPSQSSQRISGPCFMVHPVLLLLQCCNVWYSVVVTASTCIHVCASVPSSNMPSVVLYQRIVNCWHDVRWKTNAWLIANHWSLNKIKIMWFVLWLSKGLTSHVTHCRSFRGRFLQAIQCQSAGGSQLVSKIRLRDPPCYNIDVRQLPLSRNALFLHARRYCFCRRLYVCLSAQNLENCTDQKSM